jgi:hypothetical protein
MQQFLIAGAIAPIGLIGGLKCVEGVIGCGGCRTLVLPVLAKTLPLKVVMFSLAYRSNTPSSKPSHTNFVMT